MGLSRREMSCGLPGTHGDQKHGSPKTIKVPTHRHTLVEKHKNVAHNYAFCSRVNLLDMEFCNEA